MYITYNALSEHQLWYHGAQSIQRENNDEKPGDYIQHNGADKNKKQDKREEDHSLVYK
jgi:hypothetical protein